MSEMLIYLDGELVPREAAKVSVFDHGLLYGDGVFEGIRIYSRRVPEDRHDDAGPCDEAPSRRLPRAGAPRGRPGLVGRGYCRGDQRPQ